MATVIGVYHQKGLNTKDNRSGESAAMIDLQGGPLARELRTSLQAGGRSMHDAEKA